MESIFDNPQYKERWAMYDSALKAGLPIVSRETCAIICAMLLVWGNSEEFTHNHRLVCELQYAQKRFKIEGSESPDPEFAAIVAAHIPSDETDVVEICTRYALANFRFKCQSEQVAKDYINNLQKEMEDETSLERRT